MSCISVHWLRVGKGPIWQAYEDAGRIIGNWATGLGNDQAAKQLAGWVGAELIEYVARALLVERGYSEELIDEILDLDWFARSERGRIGDLMAELERTRGKQ